MDWGIALPTKADSWRVARRAEELGFTHAWFYDTALLNAEIFVAMGAAAVKTSRINLCTGVLTPSNRLAPVTASGLASLNALAPGRIICGVGTGFTGRCTFGLPPVTLRTMEDYIQAIAGLLRGETISWSMEGQTHKTRLLTPDRGIMNIADPVPIHISAFGPKGRRLVARLGTGWLGSVSTPEDEAAAMTDMLTAWRECGREPEDLYSSFFGSGSVLDPGEDPESPRVLAQAGPVAAVAFHSLMEQEASGTAWDDNAFPFKKELEAYRTVYMGYPVDERHLYNHRGHVMFLRPDEKHITGDVVRALTLTGTREELTDRVRGIRATGYKQLTISILPGQEDDMMERWVGVMERI